VAPGGNPATSAATGSLAPPPAQRLPWLWIALGVLLVAIIVIIAVLVSGGNDAEPQGYLSPTVHHLKEVQS